MGSELCASLRSNCRPSCDCNLTMPSSDDKKLPSSIKEELTTYKFWKAVRCEFLVTLFYTFLGCGATTVWSSPNPTDDLKIALAFGLSTATLVQCVGHISGAHLNPAVTLAMLGVFWKFTLWVVLILAGFTPKIKVTRNITVLRAVIYAVTQCLGAIAGAGILYGITPKEAHGPLGKLTVHSEMGLGQAFGVEFMITFLVVFTVFANLDPKRADMGSRSLAIGLSVVLGHLFAYNYTGAGMNPARALGPAVVMNHWKNHWVYWVGPMLGGIIGGFTYEYTHETKEEFQYLKRSFRRRTNLRKNKSHFNSNSTISTEMGVTQQTEPINDDRF